MAERSTTSTERAASFGPFRVLPRQQLLLEGERPVRLGSRALEILIALTERPGELVSKGELMRRVWPDVVVEESNLKVHVAALRRTLGDGQPGRRYVATVPGRGYRFVAPVELSHAKAASAHHHATAERVHNLPAPLMQIVGRDSTIDALRDDLPRQGFITIVGSGGIGKTTVALAVANGVTAAYEDGVWFVDLARLRDPQFVPSALASALGLAIHSENAVSGLIAFLRDKQILIVLDSCEHVIAAAASLAEQLFGGASGVHVLATSREPLRARGEHVHVLSPLQSPPGSSGLTAAQALTFPAVRLFVERAAATLDGFELSDTEAPVVADICRKLDGIPLAIELAATRVDAFGVRQLLALLDDRFRLLKQGRRTALARHRTLTAALDWSYEFLPEEQRIVLRRVAVFAGAFTLDSAMSVAAGTDVTGAEVMEHIANLVAKSLVSADVSGAVVTYRLLDTTRAYAMQKLAESGELENFVRRHAEYHKALFERAEAEWEARPTGEWLADYGGRLDDVRLALNWAFSPGGDTSIGVPLTVASIPLWMCLSLMDECRVFIGRALASEGPGPGRSQRDEMKLRAALGSALLYARGPRPEIDAILTAALAIAERLGEIEYQSRVLWGLSVYKIYGAQYRAALALAEKFRAVATQKGDPAVLPIGDRLIGTALHYMGELPSARRHFERMLSLYVPPVHWSHIVRFKLEQRVTARTTLSHLLWVQGFPDQAIRSARRALEDARAVDHALSLCNVLAHAACPVALYIGDWAAAEEWSALLLDHSAKHALTVWNAVGRCVRGSLLIRQGTPSGVPLLRATLDWIREAGLGLRYPEFLGILALGLAQAGQTDEARATIDEALARSEDTEERWCFAELLRIKGDLIQRDSAEDARAAAEDHYTRALDWARRQEALSWELRAATSLARLWRQHGKTRKAEELLSSVYGRFTEGFETADLRTARAMIDDLRSVAGRR